MKKIFIKSLLSLYLLANIFLVVGPQRAYATDYTYTSIQAEGNKYQLILNYTEDGAEKSDRLTYRQMVPGSNIRFASNTLSDSTKSYEVFVYGSIGSTWFTEALASGYWTWNSNSFLIVDPNTSNHVPKVVGIAYSRSTDTNYDFSDMRFVRSTNVEHDCDTPMLKNDLGEGDGEKERCEKNLSYLLWLDSQLKDKEIPTLQAQLTTNDITFSGKITVSEGAKEAIEKYYPATKDDLINKFKGGNVEVWYSISGGGGAEHNWVKVGSVSESTYSIAMGKIPEGSYLLTDCLYSKQGKFVIDDVLNQLHEYFPDQTMEGINSKIAEQTGFDKANWIWWGGVSDKGTMCGSRTVDIKVDSAAAQTGDIVVDTVVASTSVGNSNSICPGIMGHFGDVSYTIADSLCVIGEMLNSLAVNVVGWATEWFQAVIGYSY